MAAQRSQVQDRAVQHGNQILPGVVSDQVPHILTDKFVFTVAHVVR